MVVREKNCYYAIALTDFFVFLSCAEKNFAKINQNQTACKTHYAQYLSISARIASAVALPFSPTKARPAIKALAFLISLNR